MASREACGEQAFIHPSIHSFIQYIVKNSLLCARPVMGSSCEQSSGAVGVASPVPSWTQALQPQASECPRALSSALCLQGCVQPQPHEANGGLHECPEAGGGRGGLEHTLASALWSSGLMDRHGGR